MTIKFDVRGNLLKDITLRPAELEKHFGYNPKRKKLTQNLFSVAETLADFGCNEMYVDGSFATKKEIPGDIDVCFDVTHADLNLLYKQYPDFFTSEGRRKVLDSLGVHLFFVSDANREIIEYFKQDKNDNPKGIIKISLKKLLRYDKERKAI